MFAVNAHFVFIFTAIIIFAIILTVIISVVLRRTKHQRAIKKLINDLSRQSLRNIFLPDGIDGEIWIDGLLLTDGGLIVLDIRDYTGNLFGGSTINEWTQLIGGKSYKFSNPLLEMTTRVHAVQALVDVPVTGCVVFTRRGNFPKNIPDGASMIDETFEQQSAFLRPALPEPSLEQAWQKILLAAKEAA